MKTMLKPALIATSVACIIVATSAAQAEKSMTIVSWGGAYTESQVNAYHDPWTKKTGTRIYNEDKSATALAGLRSQVQANNISWDLVSILEGDAMIACDEGLIEEIDYDTLLAKAPDGTLPSKDFVGGLNGCLIPTDVYATIFAYNDKSFPGDKPKTIADVFNLKKFPGKRALEKVPHGNLEWALIADGVPVSKIYATLSTDEGVARAFKKLDTIKDQVIWWEAGAQPPQLLADQEVSIAAAYNGRIFNAQVVENQPFTIIWDGQYFDIEGWGVPKGKLTEDMKAYLHFATDTRRLADQAKFIAYGPARKSSFPLVSKHLKTGVDMQPHMPTNPVNFFNPIKKDAVWWANNGDDMNERFNAWLAK
jgi:putative spermidine/putrescine transport system substrate-binding protein